MACHRNSAGTSAGTWEDGTAAASLLDAAAGSVATRGLFYANAHSAPRHMLPLKAPAASLIDKSCRANAEVLQAMAGSPETQQACPVAATSSQTLATQVLPALRCLAPSVAHGWLWKLLPPRWTSVRNGALHVEGSLGHGGGGQGSTAAAAASGGSGLIYQAGPQQGACAYDAIEQYDS